IFFLSLGDTCRQENGGSLLVWAKPKRIENQLFTSFSFSLAAIEYAIELSSTAYLLPGDGSPPDSITERRISSRASPLDDGSPLDRLLPTFIAANRRFRDYDVDCVRLGEMCLSIQ
ncbi:unnamed protein product, partial [Brassica rapa]